MSLSYCSVELEVILKKDFQLNVAAVDFDEETKDLPYAHFDANAFEASNERVIVYLREIHYHMQSRQYGVARRLLGQILHTIHDFYSHSNWIEMGRVDINREIGTADFARKHPVADDTNNETCISNCKIVKAKCCLFTKLMFAFFKLVNFKSPLFGCPVKYYKCESNVVVGDKLVSGYYVAQTLQDGQVINKPKLKCSHGGKSV